MNEIPLQQNHKIWDGVLTQLWNRFVMLRSQMKSQGAWDDWDDKGVVQSI